MTTQARAIAAIERSVIACRRCPELVANREEVAREKRRAYRDHAYRGKPVPRMFTGDASGEWLYRALYRAGFASQPHQVDAADGMQLFDTLITAAVRCAPPGNKPTPGERAACLPYLEAEFAALRDVRVIVTLGKIADDTVHRIVKTSGRYRSPRAPFKHGAETQVALPGSPGAVVLASYHPSRQNTNTGVLTEAMLDAVFARARVLAGRPDA